MIKPLIKPLFSPLFKELISSSQEELKRFFIQSNVSSFDLNTPIVLQDFRITIKFQTTNISTQYFIGYDAAAPSTNWIGVDSTGFFRIRIANIDYNTTAGDFDFNAYINTLVVERIGTNLIVYLNGVELRSSLVNTNDMHIYRYAERGTGVNFFAGIFSEIKTEDITNTITTTFSFDEQSSNTETSVEGNNSITYINAGDREEYEFDSSLNQWGNISPDPQSLPVALPIAPSSILSELLPIQSYRDMRSRLVDNHFSPSGEYSFTGFTDTELLSFTTQQVSDADSLMSTITALGVSDKVIIELDWDGVSSTANRAFGLNASLLTANPAIDFGYDRPTLDVLIRPASGRNPELTGTFGGNELYVLGMNRIEFKDVVIDSSKLRFEQTATFPLISVIAINNSTFSNSPNDALFANGMRSLHVESTKFDTCNGGVKSSSNYTRVFNCEYSAHGEDDMVGMRGYTFSYQALWTAHAWVAGCIDYDHSDRNPTSGLHPDFYQISSPLDAHQGYSSLVECNIAHINRPNASSGSQGIFGDDGSGFGGEWLIHNNIMGISAYWAVIAYDPNDTEEKKVYGNIFLRTAELSVDQDTNARVRGLRVVGAGGGGSLDVVKNYAADFQTGFVDNENFTDNVILDPRTTAAAGTTYQEVLTGNGTFTTNGSGYLVYTSPDGGATSAAQAKTAISNFCEPLNGWAVDAGTIDPDKFPSDWVNVF